MVTPDNDQGGAVTVSSLLRKPSAFAPLAMSLAALALIAVVVATAGNAAPEAAPHDERAPARLFQLLMLLQIPVGAVFAAKWLPRAPRPALRVLFLQASAALLAIATIMWFER
jgi:heme A synthase